MNTINGYLKLMLDNGASDMFLSAGSAPYLKIDGATKVIVATPLLAIDTKNLADEVMSEQKSTQFTQSREANFSLNIASLGRFRVNVYYQRGAIAMAIRAIDAKIPELETLGLPAQVSELAMLKRGLVLIVGADGSGKSTTLASIINYRANHADDHILTIEDPIEFIYPKSRSLIDQREVGIDTLSFGDALRNALNEAPNVIMLGEIRDEETAHHAITFAESGVLCLATMHANNAHQAIERLINFFPSTAQHQVLLDLSQNVEAIISQRLIFGMQNKRVVAVEVLRKSSYISELIRQGRLNEIKHEMEQGNQEGGITFDHSLLKLYKDGRISREEALKNADSRTDLAVKIRLSEHRTMNDAPAYTLSEIGIDGTYPLH